ncbi:hypothetical protein [Luteirhabdus pelagi]|uniref:hypothetical protein n=1 Tax=Luteirhabdus pelagi TaxID=2792783 RepID=UPI00193AB5B0|nr:hypothetical protein [Luteirhabdus pelagi]
MKTNILLLATLFLAFGMSAQVGINTTDPQTTLDVNGDFRVRAVPDNSATSDQYLVVDTDGYVRKTTFDISGTFITEFLGRSTSDDDSVPASTVISRINNIGGFFNQGNFNEAFSFFTPPVTANYRITMTITTRRLGSLAIPENYVFGFARSTGTSENAGQWVARFSILGSIVADAGFQGHTATFTAIVPLIASQSYYFGHAADTRIFAFTGGSTGSAPGTYYAIERLVQ